MPHKNPLPLEEFVEEIFSSGAFQDVEDLDACLVGILDSILSSYLVRGEASTGDAFNLCNQVESMINERLSDKVYNIINFMANSKYRYLSDLRDWQRELNRSREEPVSYKADGMIYTIFCVDCNEPATRYEDKFGCENCETYPANVCRIGITDCAPCPA